MVLEYLDNMLLTNHLNSMWVEIGRREVYSKFPIGFGVKTSPGSITGGLTAFGSSELFFDKEKKTFTANDIICDTWKFDNTTGNVPKAEISEEYEHTNSTTTTHSLNNTIKVGIEHSINAKATIKVVDVETSTKFSFDYTHSWGESQSKTESETFRKKVTLPVTIPKGKVYNVIVTATKEILRIPYKAFIFVEGVTFAGFIPVPFSRQPILDYAPPYHGKFSWNETSKMTLDIGSAFSKIAQYKVAGEQSKYYGQDEKNPKRGFVYQEGELTTEHTVNYGVRVLDITKPSNDDQESHILKTTSRQKMYSPGVLVKEIHY